MSDPPAGDHPGSYPAPLRPAEFVNINAAMREFTDQQAVIAQLTIRVAALEARLGYFATKTAEVAQRVAALQAANDAWAAEVAAANAIAAEVAAANAIAAGGLAASDRQDSDAGTIEHDLPPNAPR